MLLELHQRAERVIAAGAPLTEIRRMTCIPKLVRAKSVIANDDIKRLHALHQEMLTELDVLEGRYR